MDRYLLLAVILGINYGVAVKPIPYSADRTRSNSTQLKQNEIGAEFKQFVLRYKKTYVDDPTEYSNRKAIFEQSLIRQAKLNEREKQLGGNAVYGINKFSDLTRKEFKEFLKRSHLRPSQRTGSLKSTTGGCVCDPIPQKHLPSQWDWNKKGKMTPVKNQGKCGSCWAFTAIENIESQWAITHNVLKELSIQELISCGAGEGCSGGNTCNALMWLWKHDYTVAPASECPYEDKDTPCINETKYSKSGFHIIHPCCCSEVDEVTVMKPIIAFVGPLAINVDATLWHDYLGGIIQHHCTDTNINHAVQITGYDTTGEVPYWIVRNSWGTDFGDAGYLYIMIGRKLCGLTSEPSYVVV